MRLEKQVCSLELAKKLKELGVKQNSHFIYDSVWGAVEISSWEIRHTSKYAQPKPEETFSAFTVAELGEMLPLVIKEYYELSIRHVYYQEKGWAIQYVDDEDSIFSINEIQAWFESDTEADARAKMLIYLIENNLISFNKEKD